MLQPQIAAPGAILQRFLKKQKIEEATSNPSLKSQLPTFALASQLKKGSSKSQLLTFALASQLKKGSVEADTEHYTSDL
ncbi:hypothetical protein AAC387_Pa01g2636 [Persea americana]